MLCTLGPIKAKKTAKSLCLTCLSLVGIIVYGGLLGDSRQVKSSTSRINWCHTHEELQLHVSDKTTGRLPIMVGKVYGKALRYIIITLIFPLCVLCLIILLKNIKFIPLLTLSVLSVGAFSNVYSARDFFDY